MVLSIYDAPRRFQLSPMYYSVDIDYFPALQTFLDVISSSDPNMAREILQESDAHAVQIKKLIPKNPQGWNAIGFEREGDFGTLTDGTQLRSFPDRESIIKLMALSTAIRERLSLSSDMDVNRKLWKDASGVDYTVAFPSLEGETFIEPLQKGDADTTTGATTTTVAAASKPPVTPPVKGDGDDPTVVTTPLTMRVNYMAISGDTSKPASTNIALTQEEYDFLTGLSEINALVKTIDGTKQFIELQMGTFWRLRQIMRQNENFADLYGSASLGITNDIVNKINNSVLSKNPWNPYDGTMPPVNDEMAKSGIQWALNTTSGKWELVDFDLGQGISPAAWRWVSSDNQDPWNPNAGSWQKDTSQMYDQIGRAIGDTIPSMYMPFLTAVLNNGGDMTILLDENGVPYNLGVYAWVQYALMQAHLATQPDAVSRKQPTSISLNPGEPPTTNVFDALPNLSSTIGQARDDDGNLVFYRPSDIAGTRSDIPGSGMTDTGMTDTNLSNTTYMTPPGYMYQGQGPDGITDPNQISAAATQAMQTQQNKIQEEQDALANDAAIAAASNGAFTAAQVTAARHSNEQNQIQQGEEDKAAAAADGEWVPFGKYYEMNNQKVVRIKDAASLEALAKDIAANNPSYTDKGKLYEAQYGLGPAADMALTFAKAGLAEGFGEGEMERLNAWQFLQAHQQAQNLNIAAEKQNKMNAIENKTFADAQAGTRNTSKDSTIGYNIAQNVAGAYGMTPEEYYNTFLSDEAKGVSAIVGASNFDPTKPNIVPEPNSGYAAPVSGYGTASDHVQTYATAKDDWEQYLDANKSDDTKQTGIETANLWAKYIEEKNKKNAATTN
tara:strand:- start:12844 stop:15360 length:2517 start_codon:yes stop_codon:yes gene_type:complete